ncbi:hypothetical protein FRC03_003246 [Tulasnella sp. 419]|nr:hypothetical protein FRC03_003246 [Tulasnella sp. 419]
MAGPDRPKRPRGRPTKVYAITGKRKAKLDALRAASSSPAANPQDDSLTQHAGSEEGSHDWRLRLTSRRYAPIPHLDEDEAEGETPVFLSKWKNVASDGVKWHLRAEVPTEDLCQWFETELNDYLSYGKVAYSQSIKVTWINYPGDSPHDVRARPLVLRWNDDILDPAAKDEAIKKRKPVFRSKFVCAGAHNRLPSDGDEEDEEGEENEEDDVTEDGSEDSGTKGSGKSNEDESKARKRKRKINRSHLCTGNSKQGVKLTVEVTAEDLSRAKIWQLHEHKDADPSKQKLQFSRRIRCLLLQRLHQHSARPSKVMRELTRDFRKLDIDKVPQYRIPNDKNVKSMVPAARRRHLLSDSPMYGFHLLVLRNPGKTFGYIPYDASVPDELSQFSCGMATQHSVESWILNASKQGAAIDSTWRGMNANRAPVTLVITVSKEHRVRPAAVLISANVRQGSLVHFLKEFNKFTLNVCRKILEDPECIRHSDLKKEVIEAAQRTIQNKGVRPNHWVTDKSRAQVNALEQVFPEVPIRLCQFHTIQALARWDVDVGPKEPSPAFTSYLKGDLAVPFRSLQRCRIVAEFPDYWARFTAQSEEIIMKQNIDPKRKGEQLRFWLRYIEKHWVNPYWLSKFTDIGMPEGQSRDGMRNTNNHIESAIKTISRVFLDARANKSIEILGVVLMNDFFDYHEFFPQNERRMPKELKDRHLLAHELWYDEQVEQTAQPDVFLVFVPEVNKRGDETLKTHTANVAKPHCTCFSFDQTGKLCVHLCAARLFKSAGSSDKWKGMLSAFKDVCSSCTYSSVILTEFQVMATRRKRKRAVGQPKNVKMASDAVIKSQVDFVLRKFEELDAASELAVQVKKSGPEVLEDADDDGEDDVSCPSGNEDADDDHVDPELESAMARARGITKEALGGSGFTSTPPGPGRPSNSTPLHPSGDHFSVQFTIAHSHRADSQDCQWNGKQSL